MHSESSPTEGTWDEALAVFVESRPRLLGIAYGMLGSTAEAEGVVQEVWLRWQRTDRSLVAGHAAFLSGVTVRLAIDAARSARIRRETYIGPWLPEPVDTGDDPAAGAGRTETLELALLLVLEELPLTEQAAYILRETFEYTYADIADTLLLGVDDVRKMVNRARKHLLGERRERAELADR